MRLEPEHQEPSRINKIEKWFHSWIREEAQKTRCLKSSVMFRADSQFGGRVICWSTVFSEVRSRRRHLLGHFTVLHASTCWQALSRCWVYFSLGLGSCPQRKIFYLYFLNVLQNITYDYCSFLTSPTLCREEDERHHQSCTQTSWRLSGNEWIWTYFFIRPTLLFQKSPLLVSFNILIYYRGYYRY